MKEAELHRMNFLEQRRGNFTYKTLVMILAGLIAFLGILYATQFLRQNLLKHAVVATKKKVELLNQQKERQMEIVQVIGQQKVGATAKGDLAQVLQRRPKWSAILAELVDSLPPRVELDSVTTTNTKEKDKDPGLQIRGKARSIKDITLFLLQLELKEKFRQSAIVQTKQGDKSDNMEYEINTNPVFSKF